LSVHGINHQAFLFGPHDDNVPPNDTIESNLGYYESICGGDGGS